MHATVVLVSLGVLLFATPSAILAQSAAVEHAPVGCVVAGKFPRLEARVASGVDVARAVIHFRPEKSQFWYAVAMKPEGTSYFGVLPKPKRDLEAFRYYIEVTGAAFATSRTPEHVASVVANVAACRDQQVASGLASSSVLLNAPAGAPAVPAGFASTGVVAASAGAAATVGAGTAGAAAGGGGIGTGTLLVGAGVVAAGAGAALVARGSEGREDFAQYEVLFPTPGLDVRACGATLSSQVIRTTDSSGNFDDGWGVPPIVRALGQVTPTTVRATLSCLSGSGPTGSLSAEGSGGSYQGTWEFSGSRGPVTITRGVR